MDSTSPSEGSKSTSRSIDHLAPTVPTKQRKIIHRYINHKFGRYLIVLAILLSMAAVLPARAELTHPRRQFLRNSIGGLFLHWGQRTSPQHTSCSAWEADVTNGGWNANYWVNEAE